MGQLKTLDQIFREGVKIEADGVGSHRFVLCPDNPRKCQFSGTQKEVDNHIKAVNNMKAELANGIDPFISDTRK